LRLLDKEIKLIKESVTSIFGESIIYLFGSRVDDEKSGGDIDIYIVPKAKEELFRKKLKIKTLLEDRLYKPVDIVIAKNPHRRIEQESLKGIIL
jgi:predicted nucleotidyltransferase